jgi:alpha-tubulin suppressor-like RCC1 family protein
LGVGTDEQWVPQPEVVDTEARFTSISAGDHHTCAIDTEGKAYCWGRDSWGAIGAQAAYDCYDDDSPCYLSPVEVSGGLRFEKISAGSGHTCAVTEEGSIHCWGDNRYGQLGLDTGEFCERDHGDPTPCSTAPVPVTGSTLWTDVSAGAHHTCGIATSGRVHCWGESWQGVLGDGSDGRDDLRFEPAPVAGDVTFAGLSVGGSRTCAVSADGPTYCWGGGYLGNGSGEMSTVPVPVATSARFHTVTVGGWHSCGVGLEGIMYCWGDGRYGQLGIGSSNALGWGTPVVVGGW